MTLMEIEVIGVRGKKYISKSVTCYKDRRSLGTFRSGSLFYYTTVIIVDDEVDIANVIFNYFCQFYIKQTNRLESINNHSLNIKFDYLTNPGKFCSSGYNGNLSVELLDYKNEIIDTLARSYLNEQTNILYIFDNIISFDFADTTFDHLDMEDPVIGINYLTASSYVNIARLSKSRLSNDDFKNNAIVLMNILGLRIKDISISNDSNMFLISTVDEQTLIPIYEFGSYMIKMIMFCFTLLLSFTFYHTIFILNIEDIQHHIRLHGLNYTEFMSKITNMTADIVNFNIAASQYIFTMKSDSFLPTDIGDYVLLA